MVSEMLNKKRTHWDLCEIAVFVPLYQAVVIIDHLAQLHNFCHHSRVNKGIKSALVAEQLVLVLKIIIDRSLARCTTNDVIFELLAPAGDAAAERELIRSDRIQQRQLSGELFFILNQSFSHEEISGVPNIHHV